MRVISYQIGVDVLGFPIYMQHQIYEGVGPLNKISSSPKHWVKIIQKIIKQH
ncbi:hypothetical protein MW871_15010 [Flavobacterium sp. I-SCBP12n]|uniref:Uncharacterized protein n=1 Tax=Flavobacterium pygoscelis TaxID=2893176 RepID=A0A9X2BMS5_9FLAO|nr:hypothetical protein [Flavobacterium pygoscelis]MCK8143198.1 hypothetical protein [Flavobacterium pygoscelis]